MNSATKAPQARITLAYLLLVLLPFLTAGAQTDTTVVLDAIEVTAAPFRLDVATAPIALTIRARSSAEQATDPATSLDALGYGLPGVWISDRGNASTGERVLIRGTGGRAAFGVRSTHVLLDGVPLTLADGQSQLNVVDAALVQSVEVIRGPASTFWGSGSGGVLSLSTRAHPDAPRVVVRGSGGAYGLAQGHVAVRPDVESGRLAFWASAQRADGYRDHSAYRIARGGLSGERTFSGGRSVGVVLLGAWMPRAESPGGLTPEAVAENPRQTRDLSITRDASKEVAQGHAALTYRQPIGSATVSVAFGGGARKLRNPIIPRYIALDRWTGFARATMEGGRAVRWAVGIEAETQRDDRLETTNEGGQRTGTILTDQRESVDSGALFGSVQLPITDRFAATLAARGDALRYAATPEGAPQRARTIAAFSPSLGATYRIIADRTAAIAYANASLALDAPTTTELGNRADGSDGFNDDLSPERTRALEAGFRVTRSVASGTVGLDVAAFASRVTDLLVPREIDDVTFFANEGTANFSGVELGLSAQHLRLASGRLDAHVAASVQTDTPPLGYPPHFATWTLTWTAHAPFPLIVGVDGEAVAAYSAGDALPDAPGYSVVHLRLGAAGLSVGSGMTVSPFVSLRNAADVRYSGSAIVNAFGGRYLEPSPGRHVLAGVSISLR